MGVGCIVCGKAAFRKVFLLAPKIRGAAVINDMLPFVKQRFRLRGARVLFVGRVAAVQVVPVHREVDHGIECRTNQWVTLQGIP